MKAVYHRLLKTYLQKEFRKTRKQLGLTQAQMAERLGIDLRTYSNIANNKSMCSTLTFVMYLLYCCKDPAKLLADIQKMFEEADEEVA